MFFLVLKECQSNVDHLWTYILLHSLLFVSQSSSFYLHSIHCFLKLRLCLYFSPLFFLKFFASYRCYQKDYNSERYETIDNSTMLYYTVSQ